MPKFAIVDRTTNNIVQLYEAEIPTPEAFGGPMGWVEVSAHVAVPTELTGIPMEGLAALADESVEGGYVIIDWRSPQAAAAAAAPAELGGPAPILKIAVIDFATGAIQHIYDAPEPKQSNFGGPWGWPDVTTHVAIPEGTDTEIVKPVRYEISQPAGEEADAEAAAQGYGYGWVTEITYRFEVDTEKRAAKEQRLWEMLRAKRNALLTESDWTQVADAALTDEKKEAWRMYRQALRNLPGSVADVWGEVVWPGKP
jgi:hypothetical protein